MYTIFFNYWRKASFFFLLGLLLFTYIQLPDSIAVTHNEVGRPIGFMDKQKFFYLAVAVVVGFNLLLNLVKEKINKVNFKKLYPNSVWANSPTQLKNLISGCLNAFMAFANTYLVFVLMDLQSINGEVSKNMERDYSGFLILGAVIILVLLLALPLMLLFTNPSEKE